MKVYAIVIFSALLLLVLTLAIFQFNRLDRGADVELEALDKVRYRLSKKRNALYDNLECMSVEELGSENGQREHERYNNYANALDLVASAIRWLERENNQ